MENAARSAVSEFQMKPFSSSSALLLREVILPSIRPARSRAVLALLGCVAGLSGCGGNVSTTVGSSPPPANYDYLTGNWEFVVTGMGTLPFTAMAGFINETSQTPGTFDPVTAVFQVTPDTACYTGAPIVPLSGSVGLTTVTLTSFSVNGQTVRVTATKDSTASTLTGTFKASSGCVKSATGTFTGTRYSALTGTYAGSLSAAATPQTMSLNLTQMSQGTGAGTFLTFGNATFTGFPCFNQGTLLAPSGIVLGSSVSLTFTTNDPSKAQLVLVGSIDQAADTLTLNSATVTGGSCSGSYGAAVLTKQ